MSERTSRGYMVQSATSYIDSAYEDDDRRQILERIPPAVRGMMQNVDKVAWYPVQDVAKIFGAIAAHHHSTDGKVRQALENVGRSIAETATTTFLKLVLRILTPALFTAKMPDFWRRDNRCGNLRAISFNAGDKKLVAVLDDVGGYDFIAPVAAGFLIFALEHLGYKDVRVAFDWALDNPGPDTITYELTWD